MYLQATVAVKWSGWEDAPAGLKSYHFEIFHLQAASGDLTHGEKVNDAIQSEVSADVSQVHCSYIFL